MSEIVRFIKKTESEDIPLDVLEKTKACILDWIGVSLGATSTELAKKLLKSVLRFKSDQRCSLIGSESKSDFINSAFYNATLGHILELDDTHMGGVIHPGTVIIPSVLSMGEMESLNCKDLITSIIIGYEVMIKLAIPMQPFLREKGFHATGVCGPMGVAAAVSKMLNFETQEIKNAISIAATQASGLLASFTGDTEVKPIHAGFAARNGLYAVQLANDQIIAPDVFKGYKNFFETFIGFTPKYAAVYKEFEILNVGFKIHSACRHFHSAIDALINIMKRENLNFQDITHVRVKCHSMAIRGHEILNPLTPTGVKMSLPFTLAIAAYRGNVSEMDELFQDESLYVKLKKFAENIKLIADDKFDKLFPEKIPAEVEVHVDGKKFRVYVEHPKGEPQNPLKWGDLVSKFTQLTQNKLDKDKIDEIISFIKKFDKKRSIKPLMRKLSTNPMGVG